MTTSLASILRAMSTFGLVVGLFAGCGNLTAGGFGEASVYGSGDADESPSPTPPPPSSAAPERATGPRPAGAGLIEGTLEAALDLALISEDGAVAPLNASGLVVTLLDLDGSQTRLLVRRLIPAERYAALRIRFSEVTADVLGGLVIGGVPYLGAVTVDIGATPLEVEIPIAFELEQGGDVSLLLDFNADEWLLTLDVLTQTVSSANFAASIDVAIRN